MTVSRWKLLLLDNMKTVFALILCVFVHTLAGPVAQNRNHSSKGEDGTNVKFLLVERNGKIEIEDLVNAPIEARAERDDVLFYLYTRNNLNGLKLQNCDDLDAVDSNAFDPSKKTYGIIHGWTNDYTSPVNTLIREALLPAYDVNIIVTDWGALAQRNYITASLAVVPVGSFLATLLSNLVAKRGLAISDVVLIGHSLGAHVAGSVGATLNGQIEKIVGLDAAWPLFSVGDTDTRLDISDAKRVEFIHTCGGFLGFKDPLGHVDYFPNGGESQPGCGLDLTGSCSHDRSYEYFAESLLSDNFVAEECDNYDDYTQGLCNANPKSLMGGFEINPTAAGNFYLSTNEESPFAMGS